jgi:transcriptional regulator with XRE-family HTH domain
MADASNDVTDAFFAVKSLRQALGETQQQFAYRMKRAIRTVSRWETTRPPTGRELYQLELEARRNHLTEQTILLHECLIAWLRGPERKKRPTDRMPWPSEYSKVQVSQLSSLRGADA